MIGKENKEFIDYMHILYGCKFSFEDCDEDNKYLEDVADDMLKVPEYKLMNEFTYIKKLSHRYKVNLDFKTIDSLLIREMRAENIYLWKSIWFMSNIKEKSWLEKYKFRTDETNRILGGFYKALSSDKSSKFLTLERTLRTYIRYRFDGRRFLEKGFIRDKYGLMAVGIKNDDFWCFSLGDDVSSNDKYDVNLYKGVLQDKEIKLINKGRMQYGKEVCMDYTLVKEWLDIENMDIWWTFT